jgi:hypothetical protein
VLRERLHAPPADGGECVRAPLHAGASGHHPTRGGRGRQIRAACRRRGATGTTPMLRTVRVLLETPTLGVILRFHGLWGGDALLLSAMLLENRNPLSAWRKR